MSIEIDLEGRTAIVTGAVVGDVAEPDVVEQAVATAHGRFGGLDVLVNNAANFLLKGILDTTDEEWDRLMRSNVRGVFVHARPALPSLLDSRGTMVNVADRARSTRSSWRGASASSPVTAPSHPRSWNPTRSAASRPRRRSPTSSRSSPHRCRAS
jgi:NADP-dependent 3-hydroxy acid dehydrogenase YdfG